MEVMVRKRSCGVKINELRSVSRMAMNRLMKVLWFSLPQIRQLDLKSVASVAAIFVIWKPSKELQGSLACSFNLLNNVVLDFVDVALLVVTVVVDYEYSNIMENLVREQ